MDGVTTALELEMGTADIDRWYMEREGKALINYGASVGHVPLRMKIMNVPGCRQIKGPVLCPYAIRRIERAQQLYYCT